MVDIVQQGKKWSCWQEPQLVLSTPVTLGVIDSSGLELGEGKKRPKKRWEVNNMKEGSGILYHRGSGSRVRGSEDKGPSNVPPCISC